jgi:uncharacterized protein YkwD
MSPSSKPTPADSTEVIAMLGLVRRAATLAVLVAAVSSGSFFTATAADAAGTTPVSASAVATFERDLVSLVNNARRNNGCKALRVDSRLSKAARAYSKDIATYGYFSHTGRDGSSFATRVKRAGYRKPGGENIAYGYSTPPAVITAWLNSPGHRANILKCKYKAIGVGLAYSANGTPYWTQEFGYV